MKKDGEVRAGQTRCDRCGAVSASVSGKACLCKGHGAKSASAEPALKAAADKLAELHKAKSR